MVDHSIYLKSLFPCMVSHEMMNYSSAKLDDVAFSRQKGFHCPGLQTAKEVDGMQFRQFSGETACTKMAKLSAGNSAWMQCAAAT